MVQYSKRDHNLQREKQYKRQTTKYTGDFSKPPYTSPQKDIETIWYTEPKQPVRFYLEIDMFQLLINILKPICLKCFQLLMVFVLASWQDR